MSNMHVLIKIKTEILKEHINEKRDGPYCGYGNAKIATNLYLVGNSAIPSSYLLP